jgi:hypothetical protein
MSKAGENLRYLAVPAMDMHAWMIAQRHLEPTQQASEIDQLLPHQWQPV